jgi:hypothetical protein
VRTGRRHALAAVVAVVGVLLLVAAAVRGTSEQEQPPPARVGDAAGRPDRDAPGLRAAVPRPADGPSAAAPTDGDAPGPVALGDPLPPQWPEFRPTRVVLRPDAGGGAAPVDPVGVVDGSLQLPDDADRVGWWRGGSRAGTPFGTVVVAGHLDSATDPAGFLAGLAALTSGDLVELASSGAQQRYRVVGNYLLPSADLSRRSDLFDQRRRHRLLLVTCGGPYDRAQGRYRDNRIVEAVPVTS